MIDELVAKGETVYPLQLGELARARRTRWPTHGARCRSGSCSRSAECDAADSTDLPPPLDWISSDLEEIAVDTAAGPNGAGGQTGTARVKRGMAEMLKGGVIMDVVTPEQARIAEGAGAVAVMALERVPADIRAQGGVSRMSDPDMIEGIISAVTIPVMAKARIGHFVEAQILQSLGVDYVDESEVLTPADYTNHIDKWKFTVPFVCGATNLGEALRRITEGAAMIRSKGEAGTGDVSNATTHMRADRRRDPPADVAVRRRVVRRGKGIAGALRTGRRGGAGRQAAGDDVHRRWHRHPGRRGDDDAARRRGRVRRLGHLQVR